MYVDRKDYKYLLAITICFLFVTIRLCEANYIDNEWVYAIGPIKLLQKNFLESDPFIGGALMFTRMYDITILPIYYYFDEFTATIISRLAIWCFQIWALSMLARTLGLKWWSFIALFLLWFNITYDTAAGEWVFGSASSKPVSYGFVFLALNALLKEKIIQSGCYSGLALCFHIIVGFWSAVAIFLAAIIKGLETFGVRKIMIAAIIFCILGSLIHGPVLYKYYVKNAHLMQSESQSIVRHLQIAEISVLIANPFHLDPYFFLTKVKYLLVLGFFIVAYILLNKTLEAKQFRFISVFWVASGAFFAAGLLARHCDYYKLLMLYPFRLGDGLMPVFFWISVSMYFQSHLEKYRGGRWLLILLVPLIISLSSLFKATYDASPRDKLVVSVKWNAMVRTEPMLTINLFKERVDEWRKRIILTVVNDSEEIQLWIRNNSPRNSLFITPPWDFSFALRAERAQFVFYKSVPVDEKIYDWLERMTLLNRGKFERYGYYMLGQLKNNYPRLTTAEISYIREKYSVDYILTYSNVYLDFELIKKNDSYRLYRLHSDIKKS